MNQSGLSVKINVIDSARDKASQTSKNIPIAIKVKGLVVDQELRAVVQKQVEGCVRELTQIAVEECMRASAHTD